MAAHYETWTTEEGSEEGFWVLDEDVPLRRVKVPWAEIDHPIKPGDEDFTEELCVL